MEKKITIQIVGWNSADVLVEGLLALKEIPENEVAIHYIDNNSRDGSVALVKEHLPRARITELDENAGYSKAHNIGLAECKTPYVMVHDPDLVINWPSIRKLLLEFEDGQVAAVQGKILRAMKAAGDKKIVDSAGINLTLALNGRERGANQEDRGQFDKKVNVAATTGTCSVYRLEALKKIAHRKEEIFDEDFFAYKEDVDLGWRLNNKGWKVIYVPQEIGIHRRTLGGRGFMNWGLHPKGIISRLKNPRTRYSLRNWVWMIVKNASLKEEVIHEIFIDVRLFVFFVLTLLYWPLFSVWGEIIKGIPKMMKKRRELRGL